MRRVRMFASGLRDLGGRIASPFMPTPGTTEGAVMLGMLLVAIGLVLADLIPLAFIVPGAVLLVLGSAPALRRAH